MVSASVAVRWPTWRPWLVDYHHPPQTPAEERARSFPTSMMVVLAAMVVIAMIMVVIMAVVVALDVLRLGVAVHQGLHDLAQRVFLQGHVRSEETSEACED